MRAVRWCLALLAMYAAAWLVSRACLAFTLDVLHLSLTPWGSKDFGVFALGFAGFFVPLLYGGCCALAGGWLRPKATTLLVYVGITFFCAVWAEIAANALFVTVLGRPGWLYHVWPVHHGYTSRMGLVMWPMYGGFVCLLHQAIAVNPRLVFLRGFVARALLVGVDAMALEVSANAFCLVVFRSYFFHYHASDLAHFTTWEIFLPYVLAGALGIALLEWVLHQKCAGLMGLAFFSAALISVWMQAPA